MIPRSIRMPLAVAGGIALSRLVACSSPDGTPSPAPNSSLGTVAPPPAPKPDASRGDAAPVADPFASWVPWNDLSPTCNTWIPSPSRVDDAPPPMRWEPCLDTPELRGLACRRAVVDWDFGARDGMIPEHAVVRDDGSLVFPSLRFVKQGYLNVLAEPDGKVLFSMLQREAQTCRLGASSGNGGHFGYRMRTTVGDTNPLVALVGGSLGDGKLRVLQRFEDGESRTIVAGNPGYLEERGAFTFYDWLGAKVDTITSPEGSVMGDPRWLGDMLVYSQGELSFPTLYTYTRATKRKVFRTFGNDDTRGAADLGGDGKDWVWMEGYGRAPGSRGAFPHVRAMTARVTTDGSAPIARVARDGFIGSPFGTAPWFVACGFAARRAAVIGPAGSPIQPIVVVRLADGLTHYIQTRAGDDVSLTGPMGLTCDEVFVHANEKAKPDEPARSNLYRIRLDSLGSDRLVPPTADAGN